MPARLTFSREPEIRGGAGEFDRDLGFAAGSLACLYDPAFAFGVVEHIHQEQPLAFGDRGYNRERAAVVVDVRRFGFFVERLLFGIGTVDEHRNGLFPAFAAPAIGSIGMRVMLMVRLLAPFRARAFAFRLLQRIPNAAHSNSGTVERVRNLLPQ